MTEPESVSDQTKADEALKRSAESLRDRFLRATRGITGEMAGIVTDNLYDIDSIYGLYDRAGLEYDRFDWARSSDACESVDLVDEPRRVRIPQPKTIDHYTFTGPKELGVPGLFRFRMKNVYLSYDITRFDLPEFYFITQDDKLINGLFFGGRPFREEPLMAMDSPTVFADDFFSRFNICHLLFDKLPRAHAAHQDLGSQTALFFTGSPYTSALCEVMGFGAAAPPADRRRGTIFLRECVCYSDSFHRLRHPGRLGAPMHIKALDTLRARVRDQISPPDDVPAKYFLRRAADLPRGIENSEAIETILARHGFYSGDPADLDPKSQMALFLNVTALGGVHGAGLANLAYMSPGSSIIELLPPLCATDAYRTMGMLRGLDYWHLVCDDPELGSVDALSVTHDSRNNRRNVVVPEAAFREILENVDSRSAG